MENKKNYYCAIDLGTTNTTLAFGMINPQTGKLDAKCMKLKMKLAEGGVGKKDIVPSCVLIDVSENGEIVPTVGPYAKHMNSITPQNVVMSTKSEMGKNHTYEIEGKTLSPVDISAYILDFVLKNAKEYFKERPDDLVITVPASFDSEMRTDTIKAAKKAGIRVSEDDGSDRNILLDEPRAALHNFINSLDKGELPEAIIDISTPKNVLVYDLGGGTLDVSLHKIWRNESGEVEFEDYAISLHTLVGGDNFDKIFTDYLYSRIENKIGQITESEKQRCMSKLRVLAENAKIDMTNQFFENQMMGFDDEIEMEITQANIHDNIAIDELVTEEEYEEIVSSLMGNEYTIENVKDVENGEIMDTLNIIYPILDVLAKANEKAGEEVKVDAVLLNGGMTKLPLIQRRLERFFGIEPISLQDPDLSVALGGVYYHYNLHNGIKPKNILPDTIGIETNGGVKHLAKAGVTLPHKSKVFDEFEVPKDGVNRIEIPFYLGNRTDTLPPNRQIANRSIRFDKGLKEGDKVSLQVEINTAKVIIATMWINGDEQNRRIMEVDSNVVEADNYLAVANDTQNSAVEYKFDKQEKLTEIYVDTDENKVGKNIFKDLKNFCKQHENTTNAGVKKNFINKVKNIEKQIKDCSNKHEMVGFITDELKNAGNNYFYKSRLCVVLGEIIKITGLNEDIIDYIYSEVRSLKDISECYVSPTKKTYLRVLIEALAKSRDERLEDIFIEALDLDCIRNKQFVITSIGKVGQSVDAFNVVYNYMDDTGDERPEVFWALGKIGSREKQSPLDISEIEDVTDYLVDVVKNGCDAYVLSPYNALYALAEICDRRNAGNNKIDEAKANAIIRNIKNAKLRNSTAHVQETQFDQMKEIAISVIKGQKLTEEQERCLLDVRSKLKAS